MTQEVLNKEADSGLRLSDMQDWMQLCPWAGKLTQNSHKSCGPGLAGVLLPLKIYTDGSYEMEDELWLFLICYTTESRLRALSAKLLMSGFICRIKICCALIFRRIDIVVHHKILCDLNILMVSFPGYCIFSKINLEESRMQFYSNSV